MIEVCDVLPAFPKRYTRAEKATMILLPPVVIGGIVLAGTTLKQGIDIIPPNEQNCQYIQRLLLPHGIFVAADITVTATTNQKLTKAEAIIQGQEFVLENGCGQTSDGDSAYPQITCVVSDKAPAKADEYEVTCVAPAYHP